MCQSKAEGGRRCAAHLEKYATAGLSEYARLTSGLDSRSVKAVFTEAAASVDPNLPPPTREEVDNFLHATASQVRNDPAVPEQPKRTIVSRLLDAVGRAKPSAATFAAWKSVIVDAWTKARRYAAAGFLSATMVVSVGACGNTPDQPSPDATAAPVAVQTQAPAEEYDTSYAVTAPTLSQSAINRYGRDEVEAGTAYAIDTLEAIALDEHLVNTPINDLTVKDFRAAQERMTAPCAARLQDIVTEYLASSGTERLDDVYALTVVSPMTYINTNGKFSGPSTGPSVVDPRLSKVETTLAADGATLEVATTTKATLRLEKAGKPHLLSLVKETQVYLVREGDGWKVDGWRGQMRTQDLRPDITSVADPAR